jgi:hypothetical protein
MRDGLKKSVMEETSGITAMYCHISKRHRVMQKVLQRTVVAMALSVFAESGRLQLRLSMQPS